MNLAQELLIKECSEHPESLLCHDISTNPKRRKGDAHWSKGLVLGKGDNDLYLIFILGIASMQDCEESLLIPMQPCQ